MLPSPLEPASTGGIEAVDRALARLSTHKRLLVIGAHPDDEDNALLTYVSHGLGGEAAYLSLSRGEGGQNLIGPELGVELGVIRTGELLAARRIEGTRQFFARAFDFGYTRSLDETFARWPREVLQEDAVRAVRRFKPQVVVAIFPADERAGHGQHQASAVIAADAVALSGRSDEFASLATEGLAPWQPQALYRRAWRQEDASIVFGLGSIDPHSGLSVGQIASRSRSLHRSQDMGRVQPLGRAEGGLIWIAGAGGPEAGEIFSGIDTRLAGIVESLDDGTVKTRIAAVLEEVEQSARKMRRDLSPLELSLAATEIVSIVRRLDESIAIAVADSSTSPVIELLEEKRRIASTALIAAAGIVLDATADRETVATGSGLNITTSIWMPSEAGVEVGAMRLESAAGWQVGPGLRSGPELDASGVWRQDFAVEVAADAASTMPYFLRQTQRANPDLYDWSDVAAASRGQPAAQPPLRAIFELRISGVEMEFEREVVFRFGDQAVGEVRRPVRAVPELEVAVFPRSVLLKAAGLEPQEATVEVVLRSNVERPLRGRLVMNLPPDWPTTEMPFEIPEPEGSMSLALTLRPPVGVVAGLHEASVTAVLAAEADKAEGAMSAPLSVPMSGAMPLVEYPHIRPTPVPRAAGVSFRVLEIELPELDLVGYVPGASDRVPEVLSQLGLPIHILSSIELEHGDLDRFDAIVVGSRAYETDESLDRANGRLLEYSRRGGTLLVQYQQYQFVRGGYAPFPLEIARPHGRVTDETAPVRILAADHPIFHRPNRIESADWDGWVQERGLYFAGGWDDRYTPL
ncbi:MAG: PIG-L family deacetylase, partial [Acidobacteriota bacterium]|nr:PIG-L family deacetylase [Acidobacteriota bacterium]